MPVVALPDSDHSFCKMVLAAPPPLPGAPEPEPEPEPEVGVSVEVSAAPEPEPEPEPAVFGPAPRLVALASTTDSNLSVWDTRKTSADIQIRAPASAAAEAAGEAEDDADAALQSGQCMSLHFCALDGTADGGNSAGGCGSLALLAGYEDGRVTVYTQRQGAAGLGWQSAASVKLHEEPVLSIADASYSSSKPPGKGKSKSKSGKQTVSATVCTRRLVSCGADGRIALWDLHVDQAAGRPTTARVEEILHEQATPLGAGQQGLRVADKAGMNQVAVRQDGRLAATAGWDGTVRIFDLRKKLRLLAALTYHREGVHTVAFATPPPVRFTGEKAGEGAGGAKAFGGTTAADPWLLASGGVDGRIALWRLFPPA